MVVLLGYEDFCAVVVKYSFISGKELIVKVIIIILVIFISFSIMFLNMLILIFKLF